MMDYAQRDDRMARTKPRKAARRNLIGYRIKGLAAIFLIVMSFKIALMVTVGPIAYEARLAALTETPIDRLGAWILQSEPITEAIALTIRGFLG